MMQAWADFLTEKAKEWTTKNPIKVKAIENTWQIR
jgi:hypothetical protein